MHKIMDWNEIKNFLLKENERRKTTETRKEKTKQKTHLDGFYYLMFN